MTRKRSAPLIAMHPALDPLDPFALDRTIAETARAARRWLRGLGAARGYDSDPFEPRRWASGKTAFSAVTGLSTEDPMRTPLRRWVHRLVQLRINREALISVHFERYARPVVLEGPERLLAPPAVALARALSNPRERDAWLEAFQVGIRPAAHAERVLAERRREVALRLGLESPDDIESPNPRMADYAERWLAESDDAFGAATPRTLAEWISQAGAEGLSEGFPTALGPASLGAWFRDGDLFRSLDVDPKPMPASVNPASTLRALGRLGAAWFDACAPTDQPFVVAHDPYGLGRRSAGALLAALPLCPAFAVQKLKVPKNKLSDHFRLLERAWLLLSRLCALRTLLRAPAFEGERTFMSAYRDLSERALGFAPPVETAGALFRLRDDDLQRFAALLVSATEQLRLRDAHDEDWFRNPRAIDELRASAALPPTCTADDATLERGLAALRDGCIRG